jgi:hypothetical protein
MVRSREMKKHNIFPLHSSAVMIPASVHYTIEKHWPQLVSTPEAHKTDSHLLGGAGTTHLKKQAILVPTIFVLDGHPSHPGNGITWTGTLVYLFWKNAHSF